LRDYKIEKFNNKRSQLKLAPIRWRRVSEITVSALTVDFN